MPQSRAEGVALRNGTVLDPESPGFGGIRVCNGVGAVS